MQSFQNLTVIGTSHISIESVKEVAFFIENEKPGIIALELDAPRLQSLMSKGRTSPNLFKMGIGPYLMNIIGAYAEKKLGQIVGVKPGTEMKTAVKLAKKHNLKIAVIDRDISITLRRLSKKLTFKEKLKFVWEIISSPFRKKPEFVKELDLRKVPSEKLIATLMKKVKKDYPNFYLVLVEERNQLMANNLKALMRLNPDKKVLAIVGAGHEKEIIQLVKGH